MNNGYKARVVNSLELLLGGRKGGLQVGPRARSSAGCRLAATVSLLFLCLYTAACGYDFSDFGKARIGSSTASSYRPTTTTAISSGTTAISGTTASPSGNTSTTNVGTASGAATVATLVASASSLPFGSVVVGSSGNKTVTLTNTGNTTLTVFSASMAGSEFSLDRTNFPWTLAPGASQAVGVLFSPDAAGAANATLSFVSNATNSPANVGLSGTGISPLQHFVTLKWQSSASDGVGHNIYRSKTSGGPYARINPSLEASSFVDSAVQSGSTYYYVVTTVDGGGSESAYSTQVAAAVPTP